jgi:hypothetical protein
MSTKDLSEHLQGLVKAAEDDLKRFKAAIAEHACCVSTSATSMESATSRISI